MVENAFGILLKTCKKLLQKSKLQVLFILDVFSCCWIFHNLLKTENETNIKRLFCIIESET
jgi:hypothetical protein